MKTVNIETLLPKIIPFVSGCNDTIAKIVLADATRTFARETDIITETQGYDIADAPEYGRIPEFAVDKENFLPLHFVARNEDKPNRKVYVTYSLLPTANLMPEAVIDRFHEAITSQALFMLYSMPGKPWTAPDMAQLYLQKYRIAAGDAMRDNNTGGAVFDQYMICGEPGDGGFIGAQNITATVIGTDTSDGNITPNTVLAGYAGYAKGEKVVGNIQSVTASLKKNIFTVPMGYVGSPVTLSIPEVTATLNKNTATVPVGYIGEEQKLTVPVANITNDGEYVTVPVGYVESERKFKVGGNTGVNVDFVTATASDILSGKTGADKSGNPVYGNIQTVTASKSGNVVTVPKGYIATAQTLTIDAAKAATVSGNVVTIYPGYTANQYTAAVAKATSSVSGNVVTIPAGYHDATTKTVSEMAEPSVSGNVVTIPVGYNKTQKTKTISEAGQTTVSGNVVTTPVGYVKSERKTTVGTAKGAETITPGTADRTIAAGTYLTGALTVKGDADLVAENIAEGKEIFGITGSFKGGGMDFYKCAAVYGPREVMCYSFSGCPEEAVNGTYLPTEFTTEDWEGNKQTVYSNGTYYYYYEPNMWMSWGIGSSYTSDSFLYNGSGTSWSDNEWNSVEGMASVESTTMVDTDVPKTWDGYKAVQSGGVYTFEEAVTEGLTYSDMKPQVHGVYADGVAQKIEWLKQDYPTAGLYFHAPLTTDTATAETGQALQPSNVTVGSLNGQLCSIFQGSGFYNPDTRYIFGSDDLTVFLRICPTQSHDSDILTLGNALDINFINTSLRLMGDWYARQVTLNQWYSVIVIRKKGVWMFYIGDEMVHSGKYGGGCDARNLTIGTRYNTGGDYFKGGIKNVLIYNRALTEAEIAKLNDKLGV